MAENLLDLADRLWRGDASTAEHHPLAQTGDLIAVAEGVAFVPSFANVSAIKTADGLVLVDTGSQMLAAHVFEQIRNWSGLPLHTAIYSHGHIDHVFGVPLFEREAADKGRRPPRVIAHEAVPRRFERYVLTAGYNAIINRRQFGVPGLMWPTDYRYPDETYTDHLQFDVGDERFELQHAKGETDDHTWTWIPRKKLLCCGDLFIWASPNAGNPQKVQRYPREWAAALREMAGLEAELMLPGHGLPVVGRDRVREALADTATLLESLVDQCLELMNNGARLDDLIHSVRVPSELASKPFLQPVYDEPEFIVRNIWRLYGGWYDGNPAHLKPAPEAALASEIAALAGGVRVLAQRALVLAEAGDDRLACHLAETARLAAPDDDEIATVHSSVFRRRAERESSVMATGIYRWAASESKGER